MVINGVYFNATLNEVAEELREQIKLNGYPYLSHVKATQTGLQVSCPYHSGGTEKNPSAGLRGSDGKFHCFACGRVKEFPEVISWCLGHYDDLVGSFGWQWLLKNYATVDVQNRPRIDLNMSRHTTVGAEVKNVPESELELYRYIHPYMYKRGLTDDIIDLFDIGYDSATECITFPVRDTKGNCLFVARRSVTTKYFNYPCGVQKPVYGLYEIGITDLKKDKVVICESMLDALSFWKIGQIAVALNGLGTAYQCEQIKKLDIRRVILATDMDEKGLGARQRLRKYINNKIITEYYFPEGRKDANDCTEEELRTLKEIL